MVIRCITDGQEPSKATHHIAFESLGLVTPQQNCLNIHAFVPVLVMIIIIVV